MTLQSGSSWNLPLAFEIAAEAVVAVGVGVVGVGIVDLAVGDEAADLEGAEAVELAVARLERRQRAGVDVRRDGQVAVGREPPVIGKRELEPVALSRC